MRYQHPPHRGPPRDPVCGVEWVSGGESQIRAALALTPFAGIAFLWFLGVVRDRLGDLEDRFFCTAVLGCRLLWPATFFVAMAIAGGLVGSTAEDAPAHARTSSTSAGRSCSQVVNGFALKMAGTFIISLGTMWLRTGLMPRWLAVLKYVVAVVLLVVVSHNLYVSLAFPAWVLLVSLIHLVRVRRGFIVPA